MNWLDRLERRFPQLALEGLMRYISFLMLTIFVLNSSQMLSYQTLYLDADLIMKGQVWRLFTFLLIPASSHFLFLIFELSILIMCADGLESEWGTFKLTAYYLFGALANIVMAFIIPEIQLGSYFLYLTLFLGFATVYPDHEILIFFVIPLKVKFIAFFMALWPLYIIVMAPLPLKLAVLIALGNYVLFFGPEFVRNAKGNYRAQQRRRDFESKTREPAGARHVCSVCQRTELSHPDLQFRYCTCSDCGENGKAFCLEHLKEHKDSDSRETRE